MRVAVAANFAAPHDSLATRFSDSTGIAVVATIGSTGHLYAQIMNGAPVDVFLSADTLRAAELESNGTAVHGQRFAYAAGRLALYAPRLTPPVDGPAPLIASRVRRVAIADPGTAPYGAAAMQVLRRWGVADRLAPRLVRGESIAQAFQFVQGGAAEAGFVALAQVIRRTDARYYVVPDSLHDPIRQDAVLLARAANNPAAAQYFAFLRSPAARAVIASFGYTTPASATDDRRR